MRCILVTLLMVFALLIQDFPSTKADNRPVVRPYPLPGIGAVGDPPIGTHTYQSHNHVVYVQQPHFVSPPRTIYVNAHPYRPKRPRTSSLLFKIMLLRANPDLLKIFSKLFSRRDYSSWFLASNGCRYKFFSDKFNYLASRQKCKNEGAILASKGMRESTSDVKSEILSALDFKERTWIGLENLDYEGDFEWDDGVVAIDSSQPNGNTNWKYQNPNNKDAACGLVDRTSGPRTTFEDFWCELEYGRICEYCP